MTFDSSHQFAVHLEYWSGREDNSLVLDLGQLFFGLGHPGTWGPAGAHYEMELSLLACRVTHGDSISHGGQGIGGGPGAEPDDSSAAGSAFPTLPLLHLTGPEGSRTLCLSNLHRSNPDANLVIFRTQSSSSFPRIRLLLDTTSTSYITALGALTADLLDSGETSPWYIYDTSRIIYRAIPDKLVPLFRGRPVGHLVLFGIEAATGDDEAVPRMRLIRVAVGSPLEGLLQRTAQANTSTSFYRRVEIADKTPPVPPFPPPPPPHNSILNRFQAPSTGPAPAAGTAELLASSADELRNPAHEYFQDRRNYPASALLRFSTQPPSGGWISSSSRSSTCSGNAFTHGSASAEVLSTISSLHQADPLLSRSQALFQGSSNAAALQQQPTATGDGADGGHFFFDVVLEAPDLDTDLPVDAPYADHPERSLWVAFKTFRVRTVRWSSLNGRWTGTGDDDPARPPEDQRTGWYPLQHYLTAQRRVPLFSPIPLYISYSPVNVAATAAASLLLNLEVHRSS